MVKSAREKKSTTTKARAQVLAAKRAAAAASKTGKAADYQKARQLAQSATAAVHEENRKRFLRLARGYMRTAVLAMDRIAVLCERRRKYRLEESDETEILLPIRQGVEDLADAMQIALHRKVIAPTVRQLIPKLKGNGSQLDLEDAIPRHV